MWLIVDQLVNAVRAAMCLPVENWKIMLTLAKFCRSHALAVIHL